MGKHKASKKVLVSTLAIAIVLGIGAMGNVINAAEGYSATTYKYEQNELIGSTKEFVVTYKNAKGKADALAAGEAVKQNNLLDMLNIVTVRLTQSAYAALLKNKNIEAIDENVTLTTQATDYSALSDMVKISANEQTAWGVQALQADKAWNLGFTGKGIKIAVLDTGALDHKDLNLAGGVSTMDYTTSYNDDNGHGTHVAGIISAKKDGVGLAGVAPDAQVYAVKVLGKDANGTVASIVAGINWAIQNHVDIINMSVGTKAYIKSIDTIVRKATDQGILVVAASGNNGNSAGVGENIEYPANLPNVIAVQAVDKKLKRGIFSATGNRAEISAPGVDIVSTSLDGGYESRSGTSMASPYVAGVLAIMKQANPTKTATELRDMLDSNAIDLDTQGRDTQYGFGFIDMTKLVPSTVPTVPTTPAEPTNPGTPPTTPKVDQVAVKAAVTAVQNAEKYKYAIFLKRAVDRVTALVDGDEKNALVKRLQSLGAMKDYVMTPSQDSTVPTTPAPAPKVNKVELEKAERYVGYAEKYKSAVYIIKAKELVGKLPDCSEKEALQARLDAVKK